jgi:hypothetical protein
VAPPTSTVGKPPAMIAPQPVSSVWRARRMPLANTVALPLRIGAALC